MRGTRFLLVAIVLFSVCESSGSADERDAWPHPWEIVTIEETHAPLAEKRSIRVAYPWPDDELALRRCVRQVYDSARRDVLQADGLRDTAGQVITVNVFWDRSEIQLSRFHAHTPMLQAHVTVSKPLPERLSDDQITLHWRDADSTPPARVRQIDVFYKKLFHAHVLDFKDRNYPKNGFPSKELLDAKSRFESRLYRQVYREVAEDLRCPEIDVRKSVMHVLQWQNGMKATPQTVLEEVERERASEK